MRDHQRDDLSDFPYMRKVMQERLRFDWLIYDERDMVDLWERNIYIEIDWLKYISHHLISYHEICRLYATIPQVTRQCSKDTKLKNSGYYY